MALNDSNLYSCSVKKGKRAVSTIHNENICFTPRLTSSRVANKKICIDVVYRRLPITDSLVWFCHFNDQNV